MNETIIFTDASYIWQMTEKYGDVVPGKLVIRIGETIITEEHNLKKIETLKQYVNLFELLGLIRALEICYDKRITENIKLYSDSKTAISWFISEKVKGSCEDRSLHNELKTRLKIIKSKFDFVPCYYIPRNDNPAGLTMEMLLEHADSRPATTI